MSQEIREIMQRKFVDYTAAMMTKVRRQPVSSKEVEGWTLKDWAEKYFTVSHVLHHDTRME